MNFCSIFSKGKQPFDFIKRNVIRKLAYKVKYIGQINGGLIMFFANSRIRFLKISCLDCENMERINTRQRNTINVVQCSKCYDNFHII